MPELTRLMNDSQFPEVSESATECLANIGKEAFPTLITMLTSQQFSTHYRVTKWIGRAGRNRAEFSYFVPVLLQNIRDKHDFAAVQALGKLGLEPETTVPCLVDCLK